jgi:hypothetical protein
MLNRKFPMLLFLLLACSLKNFALPFSWAGMLQPANVNGQSKPKGIKYHNGAIYVFGNFKDSIDLDMSSGNRFVKSYNWYSASGYFAKYDLQGNLLWGGSLIGVKTGNPNCIAPPYNEILDIDFDDNHNAYITGYYDDSVRLDFGGLVKGLKCPCGVSTFVAKVNPAGDVLSVNHVTGMQCPTYFSGTSIRVSSNQKLYTLTDFYGTGDFDFSSGTKIYDHQIYSRMNLVASRYQLNTMALEWSGMLEATHNLYGQKLLVDANNNMYICGKFNGSMDIDFSPASYLITSFDTSHFDYFIAKYNANGVFQWVNQYAYGGGFAFDITMDNNNHLLLAGNFKDSLVYSRNKIYQSVLLSNAASEDLFCIKIDLNGNQVWAKRIGGTYAEYFQGISVAPNNQILLSDWFNVATSLNPTSYTNDFNVPTYATNGALICLSDNGSFVFGGISDAQVNTSNGGIGGLIYSCSTWDPAGNIYIAGENIWNSDVDPDATSSHTISNNNNFFNSFVMRLGNATATQLNDLSAPFSITCFPSPANNQLYLQSEETISKLEVYNISGQCIFKANPQLNKIQLETLKWPDGLYYIHYQTPKGSGMQSVSVLHP